MGSTAVRVAVSPGGKSVYVASSVSDAVVRLNRNTTTGAITQPAGSPGCVSNTGAEDCGLGHALDWPASVAVSPGGTNVYVASYLSNAVAILDRDTSTGTITQPTGTTGCVSEDGSGPCADGRALVEPFSVAVSSDGKSVYVASINNGVARFNRDTTTGALSQPAGTAGCINEDPGTCADGHGLENPRSVAVTSDGKSVYAVSGFNYGVVRLNRNTTTGAISQPAGTAGCISENGSGPCADGHGLASRLGGGQQGREERLRHLEGQPRRGDPQPQHDHRGDHPVRWDRWLHQRERGGRLRQRPRAPLPT